jgi:hypothetical protein
VWFRGTVGSDGHLTAGAWAIGALDEQLFELERHEAAYCG